MAYSVQMGNFIHWLLNKFIHKVLSAHSEKIITLQPVTFFVKHEIAISTTSMQTVMEYDMKI